MGRLASDLWALTCIAAGGAVGVAATAALLHDHADQGPAATFHAVAVSAPATAPAAPPAPCASRVTVTVRDGHRPAANRRTVEVRSGACEALVASERVLRARLEESGVEVGAVRVGAEADRARAAAERARSLAEELRRDLRQERVEMERRRERN